MIKQDTIRAMDEDELLEDEEDDLDEGGNEGEGGDAGDGGELAARGFGKKPRTKREGGSPNHRKSAKPKKMKMPRRPGTRQIQKHRKAVEGQADMPTPKAGMRLSELGAKLNASHAAAAGHALPSSPVGMIGAGADLGRFAASIPDGLSASQVSAATGLPADVVSAAAGLIRK